MENRTVAVPASLILNRHVSLSAKLVWICLQCEGYVGDHAAPQLTPRLVKASCGLTRPTIRRCLRELLDAGLVPHVGLARNAAHARASGPEPQAVLPSAMLLDARLGLWEILLYATFQLTPGFQDPSGHFTFKELQSLAGTSLKPLRQAARVLQETGWLTVARAKRLNPIRFNLRNPDAERYAGMVATIDQHLNDSDYRGEAVMRVYLSVIIDSDEYSDNDRPAFLVNPDTDEIMELDRYYTAGVGWEYNGPQHDGPTPRYPSTAKAKKQRMRDLIKRGICADKGIHLITIRAQDLHFSIMQAKVAALLAAQPELARLLPLRNLDGYAPVIDYLEEVSQSVRKQAAKLAERLARQTKD